MNPLERSEAIVREFLGLEDWQTIPTAFRGLVELIQDALKSGEESDPCK